MRRVFVPSLARAATAKSVAYISIAVIHGPAPSQIGKSRCLHALRQLAPESLGLDYGVFFFFLKCSVVGLKAENGF